MGPVGMFFGVLTFGIIKLIYETQLKTENSSTNNKNKRRKMEK